MADRSGFSMSRATDLLVKRRMLRASPAFLPRMVSRTSLAFWAEVRTYLFVALASSMAESLRLGRRSRGRRGPRRRSRPRRAGGRAHLGHLLDLRGVPLEDPGGGELAELVPDHVLRDVHGDELLAVVDGQRVPDHLGDDGGP